MPIERDLDGLASGPTQPASGHPADPEPRFVHLLAQEWMQSAIEEGPRPHAVEGTRFRFSDAGNCSRAIAYAALGVEPSDPVDVAGYWVMGQGDILHDCLQAVLEEQGWESEIECQIEGFDGSGHADGMLELYSSPENLAAPWVGHGRIVAEWKTVGGFKFKLAVGERGEPQGPSFEHVLQGALCATALHADELVVGYLSREAISVQAAERKHIDVLGRFVAEWTYTPTQFRPLAEREIERVSGILRLLDEGMLPARKIPDPELPARHVITDPMKGTWVERDTSGMVVNLGTTWRCSYCRFQNLCARSEPGRVQLEKLE